MISTNRGGPYEIFTTRAVKLINPEDQDEWKVSIEAIVKNKSRAEELGQVGQEFVQKYKWDRVTSKIIEVYEEVLPKEKDAK